MVERPERRNSGSGMLETLHMTLPAARRRAVLERDSHVCVVCGINLDALRAVWRACVLLPEWPRYSYRDGRRAFHGAWAADWMLDQLGLRSLRYEIHHVKPRASGGSDALDNLETRCARCHREHTDDYAGERARSTTVSGSLVKKPKSERKSKWASRPVQQRENPWPKGRRVGQ